MGTKDQFGTIQKNHTFKIRPHHGMCLLFFKGKGYSNDFVANMSSIKESLDTNPLVRITSQTDNICSKCPNNRAGICNTEDKVAQYDSQVLARCNLSDGDILSYNTFRNLILHNIIHPGKREEICGNCQWTLLCHNPDYQE